MEDDDLNIDKNIKLVKSRVKIQQPKKYYGITNPIKR